jgi:ABC-type amino acid transport system permease subunit
MDASLFPYVAATGVLWALSGVLAVTGGLVLCAASIGSHRPVRLVAEGGITLTRGVPTSLLVVAAGIVSIRFPAPGWLPNPFTRTTDGLSLVAWAIVAALALGSAGHLAVIFRTAYAALGRYRIEQTSVLGMGALRRLRLVGREAALPALPPTGARLVHHLHNTAFAALFPVADLFGWVQEQAHLTFDVTRYALAGGAVYVALSAAIWTGCRALEFGLARKPNRRASHVRLAQASTR